MSHVGRVESVVSATPVLTPALYEASRRIASRFLATTSQVFSLALPPPARARGKRGIGVEAPRVAHDHRQVVGGGVACLPRWGGVPVPSACRGISARHRYGATPYLRACLSDAVAATVASGRAVIVMTPTGEHAARVARELEEDLGIRAALSGGEVSPEERYRVHIAAVAGAYPPRRGDALGRVGVPPPPSA